MGAVPVTKPGAAGTNERAPEARATLTRRVQFSATHRYHRPEWDDAVNNSVFGACAAPKPHGHDYSCDLTIAGTIDPHTGMVLDLGLLDRILMRRSCDHSTTGRSTTPPSFNPAT